MDGRTIKDALCKLALTASMGLAFTSLIVSLNIQATTTKRSSTLSNLKQLAIANLMYSTDFDDTIVLADHWMDRIMPYVKNEQIFIDAEMYSGYKRANEYGLALFEPIAGEHLPSIQNADKVPFAFQSSLLDRGAFGDLSTLPSPPRTEDSYIVSFLDSHAKILPTTWPASPIVVDIRRAP